MYQNYLQDNAVFIKLTARAGGMILHFITPLMPICFYSTTRYSSGQVKAAIEDGLDSCGFINCSSVKGIEFFRRDEHGFNCFIKKVFNF